MSFDTQILIFVIGSATIIGIIFLTMMQQWRKKNNQGQALIRTGGQGIQVSFNYMWVIPILHKLEIMDISLKNFSIEKKGKEGLICKDCIRVDINVNFRVKVGYLAEDVKMVAQYIGVQRASSIETIRQLFEAKFTDALKTSAKDFDFEDLYQNREKFKIAVLRAIGEELNGYILESMSIDYLEQTPLKFLDPNNILDAKGIKKIKAQNKN